MYIQGLVKPTVYSFRNRPSIVINELFREKTPLSQTRRHILLIGEIEERDKA